MISEAFSIGIIGQGFVGKAVYEKFKNFYHVLTFDKKLERCNSTMEEIKDNCRVIFVCVPTPMNLDGSCDISIVESVVRDFSNNKDKIIINKSTVPPGTTEIFSKKFPKIKIRV